MKRIDTSKMEILSEDKDEHAHRITFLARRTQTEKAEVEHQVFQITYFKKGSNGQEVDEFYQTRQKQTKAKMLCIGGPFAGQVKATPGEDYLSYNAANFSRGRDNPARSQPRCVWIHESLVFPQPK